MWPEDERIVQGATVLVVDDDAAIREVLVQFLEDEGYRPMTARHGREAIERLGTEHTLPDIMLLDLWMPEMDGYQVLQHLQNNVPQQIPVLIFSAQRPDTRVLEALDSDLRDFVAKPFELEELLIRIQALLQRAPHPAGAGSEMLRVYALGALRVYRNDRLLFDESWRNKPAKTIFKRLFTGRGQRYPKDVLAEELWPGADPDVGTNRLRVAIHELRKVLGGTGRRSRSSPIVQQEGSYFFNTSQPWWSDVDAFTASVTVAGQMASAGHLEEALAEYGKAEVLYQGEFLRDDPFLEWSIATRERLREARLAMLADTAHLWAALGEPAQAAANCRKILRSEPWREDVYRHLMDYLVAAGRPHEALRAYEECRRTLQAEIEASPSAETTRLRDRIRDSVRDGGEREIPESRLADSGST